MDGVPGAMSGGEVALLAVTVIAMLVTVALAGATCEQQRQEVLDLMVRKMVHRKKEAAPVVRREAPRHGSEQKPNPSVGPTE